MEAVKSHQTANRLIQKITSPQQWSEKHCTECKLSGSSGMFRLGFVSLPVCISYCAGALLKLYSLFNLCVFMILHLQNCQMRNEPLGCHF